MRIGLAVGFFDPHVGGSEAVVKRLAEGLRDRGHDVLVATSRDPARDLRAMPVPVHEFAVRGNVVQGMSGDILGYQSFLRASDRDVWLFYAAQIWTTDAALPLLGHLDAATVVVPCGYSGLRLPQFADYFRALPQFLAHASALVYMSANYQDAQHDREIGLDDLAAFIPNAADAAEFDGVSLDRGDPSRPVTVLTVANHIPDKGHAAVIRAFRAAAGPHDRLVIVGEVHDRHVLRTCYYRCRASALTDRRIRLVTGATRREVVEHYAAADVFAFGSKVECSPLVIIEAMAAGLPFVTTDVGNVRDWSDAGIVTDESGLAAALRRLRHDDALRRALGERGREIWRAHHTWDAVVVQYERLFERLLARDASR